MNIKSSKLIVLSTLLATICAFAVPALNAQTAAPAPAPAPAAKEHKPSAKELEKYDTNKDGKLDEAELAAMKADKAKHKKKKAEKAEAPATQK